MLDNFYAVYTPDENRFRVGDSVLDKYAKLVPKELMYLWKKDGFGLYNKGLFQTIDPEDYRFVLELWLGKKMDNYTPFAQTAFGELFYYRKLSDSEGDICLVDIQYRKIEVITWEMDDFLNNFLTNSDDQREWLRSDLCNDAIEVIGVLGKNEIYTAAPILALGGDFSLSSLSRGNAQVYQELVFAMTS